MANPVISKDFVTGLGTIKFVADPFWVLDSGTYYLFFEANKGVSGATQTIVYATSADGLSWTFQDEILNATLTNSDHLSYPFVVKVDGEWYMLPCSSNDEVALYHATTFPTVWERVGIMVAHSWGPRDASLFQYGGVFYMIVFDATNENCRLFYSDYLYGDGEWQEHPSSPITSGLAHSRPGGRPIVRANSIDIFFQDDVTTYGNKTRIYKITELSKSVCTLSELAGSPILDASGVGGSWNETGMHTLDRMNSSLSVVDGRDASGIFAIGIYQDV